MRKLSVLLVPVLALASVCFAQTKEAIATNNVGTSVDGPKFNPMSQKGRSRISEEAMSNLEERYNCIITAIISFDRSPRIPWKAGGDKGYMVIIDSTLIHRYSSDGQLVAVESAAKLFKEVETEEKRLCKMYLEKFGMTEDEAKKAANEEDERIRVQRFEQMLKRLEEREGRDAAQCVDEKSGERPTRLGGVARLRQRRMEMEAKQREEAERKREADAAVKAEQAEREAREQEEKSEALLQIQEQLRKHREEQEAARRADEERKRESEIERKKFFPPLMPFADAAKKAKDGDGAALFSLALHYAKGDEIAKDPEKARYYLKKAADANYPAAVLVDAIEQEWEIEGIGGYVNGSKINPETGLKERFASDLYQVISLKHYQSKNPLKDVECIDAIRSGYKKAASLGLSVATNELARFEKRMAEIKKAADIKAKNETLAKGLGLIDGEAKKTRKE